MTRDSWLTTHPYLQRVAEVQDTVERTVSILPVPNITLPNWDVYSADFLEGVPLLHSPSYQFDFETAGRLLLLFVNTLGSEPLPDTFAAEMRALRSALNQDQDGSRKATAWLLGKSTIAPAHLGLIRYL